MDIVNVHLGDVSWLQASHPVRAGGLGIRRTAQLAPSAFLASATGCLELVHQILSPFPLDIPDPHYEAALNLWREGHSHPPPDHPASCRQWCCDSPKVDAAFNSLLETTQSPPFGSFPLRVRGLASCLAHIIIWLEDGQ